VIHMKSHKPPDAAKRRSLAREGRANADGSYPTDTPGRAVAAKGRATQAVKSGRMSAASAAKIKGRANRELGKTRSTKRG
jgi:hypothetical protein